MFDVRGFESGVRRAISRYGMLGREDRVVVACSGGKDSTATLYLMKKFGYNPQALIIDLSRGEYFRKNLENLRRFCGSQDIRLHAVSFYEELGCSMCRMSEAVSKKKRTSFCSFCGVMKRRMLNRKARELGATKLVTGHNLDDEAQSILMNVMNGNTNMGLKLGPSTGEPASSMLVPRVKPLCFTHESDVAAYSRAMGFPVVYEKCPCSVNGFRRMLREQLNAMEEAHPGTKGRIVRGFLSAVPMLRKSDMKCIMSCASCGEPSRNRVCNACVMLGSASGQAEPLRPEGRKRIVKLVSK